jgi:F0F1-type ATP synthase epsilon subunit
MLLLIVSPTHEVYRGTIDKVSLPTTSGIITVYPWHVNLTSVLASWKILYTPTQSDLSALEMYADHREGIDIIGWLMTIDHNKIEVILN